MADTKLTALTETTSPATSDDVYIVTTPGGTPASKRCTIANLRTAMGTITRSGSTPDGNLAVWNGANADSIKDGGAIPTPGRVLISEQTPTNTTATFSTIPGTYKTLVIDWIARTDKASVSTETGIMWFNADTTAGNYREISMSANGSAVASSAADDAIVLIFPAATATAGLAGYGTILIPFYALTTFQKAAKIESYTRYGATSQEFRLKGLHWENTVAITQIDIVTQSAGNFVSGSTFRLYGVI